MKRVAANLRPLLTCPSFLPWHGLGALLCIPALLYALTPPDPDGGGHVAVFVLPFWSAYVLTSLQRDLLLRPFSFCLPGHRDVLRRTSFLVGIAASLVASLPVLGHPGLAGLALWWAAWSTFCFGLIVFQVTVGAVFLVNSVATVIALAMPIGFVLVEFPAPRVLVEEAALFAPGLNSALLVALSLFTWRRLGSVELARRTCGGRFLSLQRIWRRSAGEEFGERGRRGSLSKGAWGVRTRLLQRRFARIDRRPALSFRRHLAATQYYLTGHLVPASPWGVLYTALFVMGLLTFAGYAPPMENHPEEPTANAVYVGSCLLGMFMAVPVFSSMLLPASRRDRFWSALVIAASGGLVVVASCALTYLALRGLDMLLPALTIRGETHHFRTADLGPVFVPLVVVPISMALKVVCKKWLLVPEVLLFGTASLFITKGGVPSADLSPLAIVALLLVAWMVLVGVLYSFIFRRDLVRE